MTSLFAVNNKVLLILTQFGSASGQHGSTRNSIVAVLRLSLLRTRLTRALSVGSETSAEQVRDDSMGEIYSPLEMLDRLVSFPTVSDRSNLELVHWVKDYLAGHGVSALLDHNEDGTKASLFASVGPDTAGGIVLSGHTDVVPVTGQNWSTDPWRSTVKDNKVFARGACDMKGFCAVVLAAVPQMVAADLNRPVQIALTRDEEIGCLGAPPLINYVRGKVPPASIAIVGEPTMMKVVTSHKGGSGLSVNVRGVEVHSSILHKGVSAIMIAARLVDWANRMNAENMASPASELAQMFDPPWTSLHVGKIVGGTAQNITAKDCSFGLEFRCVPGESDDDWKRRFREFAAEVEREMKEISPQAGIDINPWYGVPPLRPEEHGKAEELSRRLTGDNDSHAVSYGTEAGQFQEGGYSAVVCGPGHIDQAHQADEYVSLSQLEACRAFVTGVIRELSN